MKFLIFNIVVIGALGLLFVDSDKTVVGTLAPLTALKTTVKHTANDIHNHFTAQKSSGTTAVSQSPAGSMLGAETKPNIEQKSVVAGANMQTTQIKQKTVPQNVTANANLPAPQTTQVKQKTVPQNEAATKIDNVTADLTSEMQAKPIQLADATSSNAAKRQLEIFKIAKGQSPAATNEDSEKKLTLMSSTDRRKELYKLAEEMELFHVQTLAN
ncbi:MAG: hypothetical protein VW124_09815 [Paracoccaceae bacterium]